MLMVCNDDAFWLWLYVHMVWYGSVVVVMYRIFCSEQSKKANKPPHTAKLPPNAGARNAIAWKPPCIRLPRGAYRIPI